MSDPKPTDEPDPQFLLVMRIIFAALLMGCLFFLGISIFLRLQKGQLLAANPWAFDQPIVWVALAAGPVLILLHWIVPNLVVPAGGGQDSSLPAKPHPGSPTEREANKRYQTWFILGQALLEATAFLGLIGFFLEGSGLTLALALLAMGLMCLRFPTAEAYRAVSPER